MADHGVEQRLQILEDKQALAEHMNLYCKTADRFDWAGWADTLTEDSVFEFGDFGDMRGRDMRGRQTIHDTFKGYIDHVYAVMQHMMSNLDFEVDGDNATGTGNLIFTGIMDAAKPTEYYMSGGRYQWKYRRTDAGWRIAHTKLEFIWNNGGDKNAVFQEKIAETAA